MTILPSPEAMIVICTVILIAYTAHVLDKAFASSEQFEAMLKARERIMGLQAENAKLRELVRDYERCTMHADCSRCEYDGKLSTHCPLSPCFPDADELRELGVEVDG